MAFTSRTEQNARGSSLTTPFNFVINKATGVVDGDIMFMFLAIYVATPPTVDSIPSGWTLVATNTTTNSRWYLYYKIASGEGASYTWSLTGSCRYYALNIAYSSGDFSVASVSDITVSNTLYGTLNGYVRAASMDVPNANSPLVYFGAIYNTTVRTFTAPTNPAGWVEDADEGHATPDLSVTNGSMIWTGSGATGIMDITCSTNIATYKHAFAVALKPPAGQIEYGVGTLVGVGVLAGLAKRSRIGKTTLTGSGLMAAIGKRTRKGSATLIGSGALAGIPKRIRIGKAVLAGAGWVSAIGTTGFTWLGAGTLSGVGVLSGITLRIRGGKGALFGAGLVSSIGKRIRGSKGAVSGIGSLSGIGRRLRTGVVSLTGLGTLTGRGIRLLSGKGVLVGSGFVSAIGNIIAGFVFGFGTFSGQGTLAGIGKVAHKRVLSVVSNIMTGLSITSELGHGSKLSILSAITKGLSITSILSSNLVITSDVNTGLRIYTATVEK